MFKSREEKAIDAKVKVVRQEFKRRAKPVRLGGSHGRNDPAARSDFAILLSFYADFELVYKAALIIEKVTESGDKKLLRVIPKALHAGRDASIEGIVLLGTKRIDDVLRSLRGPLKKYAGLARNAHILSNSVYDTIPWLDDMVRTLQWIAKELGALSETLRKTLSKGLYR